MSEDEEESKGEKKESVDNEKIKQEMDLLFVFFCIKKKKQMTNKQKQTNKQKTQKRSDTCSFWGFLFFLFFTATQGYFIGITVDLFETLRNPFRNPNNTPWAIHFVIWVWAFGINFLISLAGAFRYRSNLNMCATCNTGEELNPYNVLLMYAPLGLGGFLGTIAIFKTCSSLRGAVRETLGPRILSIRQQLFVVITFTFCTVVTLAPLAVFTGAKF
ncbi:hypothetical protein RFI_07988, partial [Reticulomyxa filosa]